MKQYVKLLGLSILLLANEGTYAVNPPQGWYAGLIIGPSYTPNLSHTYNGLLTGTPTKVTLTHTPFGNIAIDAGYRMTGLRLEGEFLFNGNPYKQLKVGSFVINNASGNLSPTTPTGMSKGLQLKGQTYTAALFGNVFYDFFTPGAETSYVPYIGAGIGYARVYNGIKFYEHSLVIPGSNLSSTANAPAVQGIIGLSYFLDDFASFGLDFRYLTTKSFDQFHSKKLNASYGELALQSQPTSRLQLASVNLTFTGSFDCA